MTEGTLYPLHVGCHSVAVISSIEKPGRDPVTVHGRGTDGPGRHITADHDVGALHRVAQ
jgi:hypothetical protein